MSYTTSGFYTNAVLNFSKRSASSINSALERVYLSSPFLLEAIFYSGKAANLDNSNLYLTFANAVRVKNGPSPSGSA
ncbi:hypothetical protein [Vibrio aerogenes]|uniref:hypothetical protein n=1 Tax=Vibrio aerogenes TaxID=92172 RepID=UPI001114DEF9|nr:hypothetical protein [Vibrio aerogenes]